MMEYKTFYNFHKTNDKEVLKGAFEVWAAGAINVPSEEKASYYFKHFVISGISYEEFTNLIGW